MRKYDVESIRHTFMDSEDLSCLESPEWSDVMDYLSKLKIKDGYFEMVLGWYNSLLSVLKKDGEYVLCITCGTEYFCLYELECADTEIVKSLKSSDYNKIKNIVWKFYKFEKIKITNEWNTDFAFV